MEKTIVLATKNTGKLIELSDMLKDAGADSAGVSGAGAFNFLPSSAFNYTEPAETGSTFEENALIKAKYLSEITGLITLSDDSGLEVNCLNKQPGVYSADLAGHNRDYDYACQQILSMMLATGSQDTSAQFVTTLCLYIPEVLQGSLTLPTGFAHNHCFFYGTTAGHIVSPKGSHGFAYDKIFVANNLPVQYALQTFAEIPAEIKNLHSHRKNAIMSFIESFVLKNIG